MANEQFWLNSDGKTLAAAALVLDIGVVELEHMGKPFFHIIELRPLKKLQVHSSAGTFAPKLSKTLSVSSAVCAISKV